MLNGDQPVSDLNRPLASKKAFADVALQRQYDNASDRPYIGAFHWSSLIENCRAYRGGITGNVNGTDHTLVPARFTFQLDRKSNHAPESTYPI